MSSTRAAAAAKTSLRLDHSYDTTNSIFLEKTVDSLDQKPPLAGRVCRANLRLVHLFVLLFVVNWIGSLVAPVQTSSLQPSSSFTSSPSQIRHHRRHKHKRHSHHADKRQQQRVMLISLGGFRHDYIETYKLENLAQFAREGVKAAYLKPQFTSESYPNLWSMVTGANVETHGIIANTFYDPLYKESFSLHKSGDVKWWNETEPVWFTAVRQGVKTSINSWPGGSAIFFDSPNYRNIHLDDYANFQKKIDLTLKWILHDLTEFAVIYENQIELISHKHGINSPEFNVTLSQIDQSFGKMVAKMKACNLYDASDFNVLIVSDHGMTNTKKNLFIDDYISEHDAQIWSFSPTLLHLRPLVSLDHLLSKLGRMPNVTVSIRDYLPEFLSYKSHRRIGQVIVSANEGVAFIKVSKSPIKITQHGQTNTLDLTYEQKKKLFNLSADKAHHGYNGDYASMHGIFLGRGAMFKKHHSSASHLDSVDIYPLLCTLLSIECEKRNGSFDRIREFLRHEYRVHLISAEKQVMISVKSGTVSGLLASGNSTKNLFIYAVVWICTLLNQKLIYFDF